MTKFYRRLKEFAGHIYIPWKDVRIPLIGTIECALGKIVEGIIAHE